MTDDRPGPPPPRASPPSKHQLALMIWVAVFPTLTPLNVLLGDWLGTLSTVPRTFVLATAAVPIVIYGVMPHLHRARARLLSRSRERALPQARWLPFLLGLGAVLNAASTSSWERFGWAPLVLGLAVVSLELARTETAVRWTDQDNAPLLADLLQRNAAASPTAH